MFLCWLLFKGNKFFLSLFKNIFFKLTFTIHSFLFLTTIKGIFWVYIPVIKALFTGKILSCLERKSVLSTDEKYWHIKSLLHRSIFELNENLMYLRVYKENLQEKKRHSMTYSSNIFMYIGIQVQMKWRFLSLMQKKGSIIITWKHLHR